MKQDNWKKQYNEGEWDELNTRERRRDIKARNHADDKKGFKSHG